jgi:predicted aconitase with swiveling domain
MDLLAYDVISQLIRGGNPSVAVANESQEKIVAVHFVHTSLDLVQTVHFKEGPVL